jgi:hypothetical protein
LATEAIIARAESFTLDGAWPSAQFTALSAEELVAAVVDQLATPVAKVVILQKKKAPVAGASEWG